MTILPCETGDFNTSTRRGGFDGLNHREFLSFVLPYEKLAVGLVSRALLGDTDCFVVAEDGRARDAFSLSKGGQIFHCLPDAYTENQPRLLGVLTAFFAARKDHELFNVVGEEKGTDLVKRAIQAATGRGIQHEQRYVLLEKMIPRGAASRANGMGVASGAHGMADFDGANSRGADFVGANEIPVTMPLPSAPEQKLALVHCAPSMIDDLLPLQIAYEKEEVEWEGNSIDQNVTRLSFLHALRTQQIFALSKNGAYIAKGGTNAIGKNYVQLGGIYTIPSERGKGYAECLVRQIIGAVHSRGKNTALFAKPDNVPALRLYEKCGFKKIGRYEIAYY